MYDNKEQAQHPCHELKKAMIREGMNQKELAVRTGSTEKHISTILSGERDISVAFARKLGYVFDEDAEHWLTLQTMYDAYQSRVREENEVTQEELDVLKPLHEIAEYFIKRGYLQNHCGDVTRVIRLRMLLGVSNLTAIPRITYNAAYRAQITENVKVDPYVLFAWQRLCEKETEAILPKSGLNINMLRKKLGEIKAQMFSTVKDGISSLREIFAQCGVAFQVVRNFRGAPVQGFIKKTDIGKVILCLTIRGGREDTFWFTLFHEVGHLLHGDVSTRFVDFDSISGKDEEVANRFAGDFLIHPDHYRQFLREHATIHWQDIETFASQEAILPSIVLGRLQKDRILDWSDFSDHVVRFKWAQA